MAWQTVAIICFDQKLMSTDMGGINLLLPLLVIGPMIAIATANPFSHVNDCRNQADGTYLNDPRSCSHYYICYQGQRYRQRCPSGLFYDDHTRMCNIAGLVKCAQLKRIALRLNEYSSMERDVSSEGGAARENCKTTTPAPCHPEVVTTTTPCHAQPPRSTTTTPCHSEPPSSTTTTPQNPPSSTTTTPCQTEPPSSTTTTPQNPPSSTTTTPCQTEPPSSTTTTPSSTTTTPQNPPSSTTTTPQNPPSSTTTTPCQTEPPSSTTTTPQNPPSSTTTTPCQTEPPSSTTTTPQNPPSSTTTTPRNSEPPSSTTTTPQNSEPPSSTTTTPCHPEPPVTTTTTPCHPRTTTPCHQTTTPCPQSKQNRKKVSSTLRARSGKITSRRNQHPICVGQAYGSLVRDPNDCGKFHACLDGRSVEFNCPANLYFDETKMVCNFRNMVKCDIGNK
uniref:Chitin-binding type-2 domain-containing protein n=1 Tax=Musca domestica TaxID=7370 RepID=A0A1I8M8Q3_MUSDO